MSAQERAQQSEQITRILAGAKTFYDRDDRHGFDSFLTQNGVDPAQYQFDQFPALANQYGEAFKILAGSGGGDARVQSSDILDHGTVVTVMSNGMPRVVSPTGEVLSGQATADAVKAARAYTVENQREVYHGRKCGTLDDNIDRGADAAGSQEAGKAAITMGHEAMEQAGKARVSISNIDEAIAALDSGASTGVMAKYVPNVTEASASLNNAANKMGLDIIGATTFGALSEGEMKFALETAMPRNLAPAELRNWLIRKKAAQEKAMITPMDATSYLSTPGNTLDMWIERNQHQPVQGQTQQQAPAAPQPHAAPQWGHVGRSHEYSGDGV